MAIVSIGILAHNEEQTLPTTLSSLADQSLFDKHNCELVLVPNGCSDRTVAVAERAKQSPLAERCKLRVETLELGDKCRAWSAYVHDFSDPQAEYVFLLDADIELSDNDTLLEVLELLQESPQLWATGDVPRKHFEKGGPQGLWESIASRLNSAPLPHSICGQLYCMRGELIRRIRMPLGLPVEDGFVRAMVDTGYFTEPDGKAVERIERAQGASHYFQAVSSPTEFYQHEKRIVVGTIINFIIFGELWKHCSEKLPADQFIRERLAEDPRWPRALVEQQMRGRNWVIPRSMLLRRARRLKELSWPKRWKYLPKAVALASLDLGVFVGANRELIRNRGLGLW